MHRGYRGLARAAALAAFATLTLSVSLIPSPVRASEARYTTSFPVPSALPRALDPGAAPALAWSLEPSPTMRPRVLGKVGANGTVCVWIGTESDKRALVMDERGVFAAGAKTFSADCTRSWSRGRALAFRVFAAVSEAERERLGADGEFRIGWTSTPSGDGEISLADLRWVLEASTAGGWVRVADVGARDRSEGSGWVSDPDLPSRPALVLADGVAARAPAAPAGEPLALRVAPSPDETVVTPLPGAEATPIAPPPPRPPVRPATLPERELEFSLDEHGEPAGLYVGNAAGLVAPVIAWNGGETIGRLRLQVIEALSDPARGRYCVRAVYDEAGTARRLGRAEDGRFSTAAAAPSGTPDVCSAEAELVFPIHVAGAAFTRKPGRFLIGTRARGEASFSLSDAIVALRSGRERLASNAGGAAPNGGWFVDGEGRPALLLRGGAAGSATGLRYVTLPAEADGEVLVDGVIWPEGARRDVPESTLTLAWNGAGGVPPSRVLLCSDERCEQPFASLPAAPTGTDIDPRAIVTDTARPTVTIGVDWRDGGADGAGSGPRASAPVGVDGAGVDTGAGELVFAPRVSWGGYSRALTSCLGQLVGAGAESEPFALRRGLQVLDLASLPPALADGAPLRVSFARGRDGEDCALPGLATAETTLEALRAREENGEIVLDVPLEEKLFVGYLQLNNRLYASSLARWKNLLEFFGRLYAAGHERARWADGVLFGAGERDGVVTRLEPAANFVASLGDSALMREIAGAQRDNRRVASQFFGDQVEALTELFGERPIELVYYDDLATDCESYAEDLARSSLAVGRVVVIAGIDGYTANDGALRSLPGRLAHVCVEREALLVYAFNWRERADNEDFMQMLTTVLEDLERGEESAR